MRKPIEYEIIQNPVLGAAAITQAIIEYHEAKDEGMPLTLVMVVLPMVFHKKTIKVIAGMVKVGGGLRRALGKDRTLSVGLQQRMEKMAGLSFTALNIALSCKMCSVLTLEKEILVTPLRKTLPFTDMGYVNGDGREILKGAVRVGNWLGSYDMTAICRQLDLRF
jgi:hypothetical protein